MSQPTYSTPAEQGIRLAKSINTALARAEHDEQYASWLLGPNKCVSCGQWSGEQNECLCCAMGYSSEEAPDGRNS